MKAEDIKWCPQHGYPLPCYKCGMPLSQPQQKEIYEDGRRAGIKEVVGWIESVPTREIDGAEQYICTLEQWQAKLKEWGIND